MLGEGSSVCVTLIAQRHQCHSSRNAGGSRHDSFSSSGLNGAYTCAAMDSYSVVTPHASGLAMLVTLVALCSSQMPLVTPPWDRLI